LFREKRLKLTPEMIRRRESRQLFGEFNTQLHFFEFGPALRARKQMLCKLFRFLIRQFSMTIS
jgi:hypothetical protein